MAAIAKIHPVLGLPDPQLLATHPVMHQWLAPEKGLLYRLRQAMAQAGASPARCVVLLPYAQLRPLAQRLWQQVFDDGFAPRFETTRSWTTALGAGVDGIFDLRQDRAQDLLTAHSLLVQAGQSVRADQLAPHLVDAALQLAPLAAGRAPQQRAVWAQACRDMLRVTQGGEAGQWEALVAQVALEWVHISAYASDVLYTEVPWQQVDLVLQVCGLNADPLAEGLQAHWGPGRWVPCQWMAVEQTLALAQSSRWRAHACLDAQDEARRSAACAVRHIQAGRFPLALVSSDRAFTRQIQVQLEAAGVSVRDETGWKLSTTRAGTYTMALLRAAVWNASTDTVLAWLKLAPFASAQVDALEALLRRYGVRDWAQVARLGALQKQPALVQLLDLVAQVREPLQQRGTLTDALGRLRGALQRSGYGALLEATGSHPAVVPEGSAMLACLQLDAQAHDAWAETAQRTWSLAEFTAWVNQSLEAASWSPEYPQNEQVVLVPMSQLLARPFAAVLLCGCDEQRLPASAPPAGIWTRAQREALGLPSREALDQVQRLAWATALHTPEIDILWRTSDDSGEALMPSTLVQALQVHGNGVDAAQSAWMKEVSPQPQQPPQPQAQALGVQRLSASAYDDLRTCPYRFFALRILGLQSDDELEQDVDKRDFGVWLHEVLSRFHRQLALAGDADRARQSELLDAAADAVSKVQGLAHAEFLPFMASWPAVRDHYLGWLQAHQAAGYAFEQSELARERSWQGVRLQGRLDRVDRQAQGGVLVLDYKTESSTRVRERIASPMEDTQMAFYGALLQEETADPVEGSYLMLSENECKAFAQPDMALAVQSLLDGIAHDVQQIAQGAALPALGEGDACTYCAARGLCRKDTWGSV
ncbi:MAG: PD-(D/E)XK nuclease family protein [Rhodoferax sp.]|nr:MAG: PD-(D/E)XK nuclease family protein [Rhodoferax sp.]